MGTYVVAIVALLILLGLALIAWRVDKIPGRIGALVKQERVREDSRAQAALLEAAALKVGPLIAGIRTAHEQIVASLHAQLADAEMRARIAERRAVDASTYLVAASALVGDLRALRDEVAALVARAPTVPVLRSGPSGDADDPDQRATIEVRGPGPVSSQVRAVALPGAARVLSAEPAMVAARLIERGGAVSTQPEPRRARALSGTIDARREEPASPSPSAVHPGDAGDAGDAILSERPSDPEGERTRVGPRFTTTPVSLPVLKPTLLSFKAVAQPTPRPVAPVEIDGPSQNGGGA